MSGVASASSPQGMPNLGVPLVNESRHVEQAWYRFFVSIFNAVLTAGTHPATGLPISAPPGQSIAGNTVGLAAEVLARQAGDAALGASVTTLQGQVNGLQTQVNALTARVVTLESQMLVVQGQIDAMTVGTVVAGATAGTGGVLPAQVNGYLNLTVSGTSYKAPLYNP